MSSQPKPLDVLILSCPADVFDTDALCASLSEELAKAAPQLEIRRSDQPVAPESGEVMLTLRVTRALPTSLDAHFEWHEHGQAEEAGPMIHFGVLDAEVRPEMYPGYARALIKGSALPFLGAGP